jgi:hypothetical protein
VRHPLSTYHEVSTNSSTRSAFLSCETCTKRNTLCRVRPLKLARLKTDVVVRGVCRDCRLSGRPCSNDEVEKGTRYVTEGNCLKLAGKAVPQPEVARAEKEPSVGQPPAPPNGTSADAKPTVAELQRALATSATSTATEETPRPTQGPPHGPPHGTFTMPLTRRQRAAWVNNILSRFRVVRIGDARPQAEIERTASAAEDAFTRLLARHMRGRQ